MQPAPEGQTQGIDALKESLKNVIVSSPEATTIFADQLEAELSTLDSEPSKEALRKAVAALRAFSKTMQGPVIEADLAVTDQNSL